MTQIVKNENWSMLKIVAFWPVDGGLAPATPDSRILTHAEFAALVSRAETFYAKLAEDEIEKANAEKQELHEQRMARRLPKPPSKAKPGWVYVLVTDGGLYKIGRASDPIARHKMLGTEIPTETKAVILEKVADYIGVEAELHKRYADKRLRGEWFRLSAGDLEEIRAYLLTLAIERMAAP